jgi:HD-like signal output (HDOD) protein
LTIASLFDVPMALPMVPKVIQQLIQSFRREDTSVHEVAAQLASDPVIGAKTLRLANSACFHFSRKIGTVDEALQLLGFVMVRNLVLGFATARAFKAVPGMDMPRFWRHSLYTACGARWLARQGGGDDDADLAFTIGLLHGLGQLVMHAAMPEMTRDLDRVCHPLDGGRAALEVKELGYQHGAVSAELARRWNFPADVCEPLSQWPMPLATDASGRLTAIVHIAAWRARVAVLGWSNEQAQDTCPVAVGAAVGLPLRWLAEEATLAVGASGAAMPPLAELTEGLEAMFE